MVNVLHNIALNCFLILIIYQLIWTRCFIKLCCSQSLLGFSHWNSNAENLFRSISIRTEHTMQNSSNLHKPFPLKSFVLHQIFKVVQFSDKLKPLGIGRLKILNKPTKITYDFLTHEKEIFHTYWNQLKPAYPKELLPSPYIQSYKEQNVEKNLDSDASDMFQEDLYTSYDNAEI